jgi:hypothetical protein
MDRVHSWLAWAGVLAAVLVGGLLAGCRSSEAVRAPTLPDAFPHHAPAQIQARLAAGSDTLRAFRADARLSLDAPGRDGSFGADVRQRRSDSLYLAIRAPLGIEAARLLVTPDSFYVYNRLQRELAYGSVRAAQQVLPAPLVLGDAFETLLGLLVPADTVAWTVTADSTLYYLRNADDTRRYQVDPRRWRVLRYEERTPDGTLVEERRFADFTVIDGVYVPRRVTLRRPLDDVAASLYYRELTLNPARLSFDLRVRGDARRVPLGIPSG